jgi:hypothetical protein
MKRNGPTFPDLRVDKAAQRIREIEMIIDRNKQLDTGAFNRMAAYQTDFDGQIIWTPQQAMIYLEERDRRDAARHNRLKIETAIERGIGLLHSVNFHLCSGGEIGTIQINQLYQAKFQFESVVRMGVNDDWILHTIKGISEGFDYRAKVLEVVAEKCHI